MEIKTAKKWKFVTMGMFFSLLSLLWIMTSCQSQEFPNVSVTLEKTRSVDQLVTSIPSNTPTFTNTLQISTDTASYNDQSGTPLPHTPPLENTPLQPTATTTPIPFVLSEPLLVAFTGVDFRRVDSVRPDPTVMADPTIYPRLYTINSDGTGLKLLVDFPVSPNALAWSPEGEKIAFTSLGNPSNIYTIAINETEPNQITDFQQDEDIYSLVWSSDNKYIAFDTSTGIYLLDLETGKTSFLIPGEKPTWSSNGEFIIYGHYPELYRIRLDGSDSTCLTCDIESPVRALQWQFPTERILFSGEDRMWIMDEDGQNKQPLKRPVSTTLPDHILASVPNTGFNNEYLIYGSPTGNWVYMVDIETSKIMRLGNWELGSLAILKAVVQP